jgi:hypothetical protein
VGGALETPRAKSDCGEQQVVREVYNWLHRIDGR